MAIVKFKKVNLKYPIYNLRSMSLRNQMVRAATGGKIEKHSNQITTVQALKNATFTLNEGDSVGLIGHNGSGKSTLLRTIAQIYPPDEGMVEIKGTLATVFELGAGLEPELSGYENIIQLGMMMGMPKIEAESLVPDVEEFTDLGEFLKLPVRTYSSGMTMRLMFAVATSTTPEILLIDEMFGTGDASFQKKSSKRIQNMIESSKIFVFASHNEELIKKYCNRLFKLDHGHIEETPMKKYFLT